MRKAEKRPIKKQRTKRTWPGVIARFWTAQGAFARCLRRRVMTNGTALNEAILEAISAGKHGLQDRKSVV
jgi:hypothetical protein